MRFLQRGALIGVVETDKWLDNDFQTPLEICQRLSSSFGNDHAENIYKYLLDFGMYRPNRQTLTYLNELKRLNSWDVIEKLFSKYRKKWDGPDIPLYLLPMKSGGVFDKVKNNKSGVSFIDKMFLFITPLHDEKEIEALFIHEYHHVCRLNQQKEKLANYTLLDSMILEGLAENAVAECCGDEYQAKWCTYYSSKEISQSWNRLIKSKLTSKKSSSIHDKILFGGHLYPPLLGYAVGYEIIQLYKHKQSLSLYDSFHLPSDRFKSVFPELESPRKM